MNKAIDKIIQIAEQYEWSVNVDTDDSSIEFSKYSPAGQDFSFTISYTDNDDYTELLANIENAIYEYWSNFDVSTETYLWLDEDGHGKNGAPYDMSDVYDDMKCCHDNIYELYKVITRFVVNHHNF